MCERFPELDFHLNGGVKSLKHAREIVYGKRVSDKMSEIPNINWETAVELVEKEMAEELAAEKHGLHFAQHRAKQFYGLRSLIGQSTYRNSTKKQTEEDIKSITYTLNHLLG